MKTLGIVSLVLIFTAAGFGQSSEDRAAVKQAALDYIEAVYNVNPAQAERSVHPELVKRGFFVKRGETSYSPHAMTFTELVELAKTYNARGTIPKDAPKEVVVFDVVDQTASVKVTAVWGIDYMHLAKYDGKWKIINILWQSPPKAGVK
ncbi:MAG: nuclear transport factor 2 family protein [Chloracidobacterium sp.]|nr:nuclear transport factor 2 family protein [Chloracidobacterium sp.]